MYFFQLCRRKPRARQGTDPRRRQAWRSVRTTTSARISRRATIPGSSGCAWCRTAICSRRSADKRASVVTNQIDSFTKSGIRLKDGSELEADIIVTATGLDLQVLGGLEVSVDGREIDFAQDAELQGHDVFGRAEHGLRVRLHQCVVDAEMRPHLRICLPPDQLHGPAWLQAMRAAQHRSLGIGTLPSLDFSSGYVQRSIAKMPKQGSKRPWRLYQNYALDIVTCATARSTTA